MNIVVLTGNLTREPEIRYATSGTAIVKFGLAVTRRVKSKEGNWVEKPVFVDITMFGKRGEAFAKHHKKGSPAMVQGELDLDQWEDKNTGAKRSKLFVIANEWEFRRSRAEAEADSGPSTHSAKQDAQTDFTQAHPEVDDTPF